MSRSRSRSRSRSPPARTSHRSNEDKKDNEVGPADECAVFTHNLPRHLKERDLEDLLRDKGFKVSDVKLICHADSNASKGMATFKFPSLSDAREAIKTLDGMDVEGRRIVCREDRGDGYIHPDTKGKGKKGDRKGKGKGKGYRRDSRPRRRDDYDRGYGRDRGGRDRDYDRGYGGKGRGRDYDRGYDRRDDRDRGYDRRGGRRDSRRR